MRKPNNYEAVQAYSDYIQLPPGGYVCKVCKVDEVRSSTGKDMWNIWLDIEEGEFKGKFTQDWQNDDRTPKKWGCIVYQLTEDKDGNTHKGLKTFMEALKRSNNGFDEANVWLDSGDKYLKGKLVGGIFRREEYINNDGEKRMSVKCCAFKDVTAIREGKFKVPADKLIADAPSTAAYGNDDFVQMDDDGDLPF